MKVVIEVPVVPLGKQPPDYVMYNGERKSLQGYNLWNHIQDAIAQVANAARLDVIGGVITITLESNSDTDNSEEGSSG